MENKYFIVKLPDAALEQLLSHCVETLSTARRSLDKKEIVIKLPVGATTPQAFNHLTPLSHSEVLAIMATPEWTNNDLI